MLHEDAHACDKENPARGAQDSRASLDKRYDSRAMVLLFYKEKYIRFEMHFG